MKKRINLRAVIGLFFEILGVLGWVIGLCIGSEDDEIPFVFVNSAFILVGSLFIYISIKINPERLRKVLEIDETVEKKKYHRPIIIPITCYVMDGYTPIPISYPLSDWDRCYLIAWQEQKKTAEQR